MFTNNKNLGILICVSAVILSGFPVANGVIVDPKNENPTDDSISITINNVSFEIKDKGNGFAEITLEVSGKTYGEVNHCGIAFITYFKNGTTNYGGVFVNGPINVPSEDAPVKFIGTGVNGSWSTWRFYNHQTIEKDKVGINESQLPYVDSFMIWTRAYTDENGLLWNQSSKNVTEIVKAQIEKFYTADKEDGKTTFPLIYYFIIIFLVIGTISYLSYYRLRKKTYK